MELMELIDRLKAATGPDRELDAQIWCAVNGYEFIEWDGAGCRFVGDSVYRHTNADNIRKWTASIDAALALVERMLPDSAIDADLLPFCFDDAGIPIHGVRIFRKIELKGKQTWGCQFTGDAPTPALAILIALFTALETRHGS